VFYRSLKGDGAGFIVPDIFVDAEGAVLYFPLDGYGCCSVLKVREADEAAVAACFCFIDFAGAERADAECSLELCGYLMYFLRGKAF